MALTNAYATVAEVRDYLKDPGSKLDTDMLEFAIDTASREIDQFCGRRFWQDASVKTREYRPGNPDVAFINDVATTTGLIVKTDTTGDGSWATIWDAADYQLEPLNADDDANTAMAWWRIVAIDDQTFPVHSRRTTLQVTATFGWSAIPKPIRQACVIRASSLFRRADAPFGVAGFGEFGAVRVARFDPDVRALLHPLVKMTMAAV